jgi:peptide/nickel transport system permease protein
MNTARRIPVTLRFGALLVGLVVLGALVSLVWLPHPLEDTSGGRLEGASWQYPLGTDRLGHDLLTRVLLGARLALQVGLGTVLLAGVIGTALGIAAALSRGWLDDAAAAVLDTAIAFPTLLLAMLVVAAAGASLWTVTLAIGLSAAAVVARLTRILAGGVLRQQYTLAARTSGAGTARVVVHHVLPNIWPMVTVNLALLFGGAVLAEAGLSYLGLGAPPPNASWGNLLHEAQATFLTQPLGAIAPGVAIVVLVVGMNLLSDGLRTLVDPTLRGHA